MALEADTSAKLGAGERADMQGLNPKW